MSGSPGHGAPRELGRDVRELDREVAVRARQNDPARRLITVPGIDRHRHRGACARTRLVPFGARLCRLDRPDTRAAVERRQGKIGEPRAWASERCVAS
jgi:hypothetical protein